jgi:hypothetical protein
MPQYIASSRECVSPPAVVAPEHDATTAWSAEASVVCGCVAPDGAAKPRTIAVRGTATPMRVREEDAQFDELHALSFRDPYIPILFSYSYVSEVRN